MGIWERKIEIVFEIESAQWPLWAIEKHETDVRQGLPS